MSEIEIAIQNLDIDKIKEIICEPQRPETRSQKRMRKTIEQFDKDGFNLIAQVLKHLM